MDGCSNDVPEHVAKIHKSVSMKQPHWEHDGFMEDETRPCSLSRGHGNQCHRPGESRSRPTAGSSQSSQSTNPSQVEKTSANDSIREHHHSKSAATEHSRNKSRRPDIQVYVPRAKRLQQSVNADCIQKEMPEDNIGHDKSGNQALEKPSRRPKPKSRPSLEPYIPRPRRSAQQTETTTTSQSGASNIGQNNVTEHGIYEEHESVAGDMQRKDDVYHSGGSRSSVGQSSPERLKRSPNYLEMNDEDVENHNEKQPGHHKSKRKHHSKDKEGREERKSQSKERKIKHHSKHKKHPSKDNVSTEDKQSYAAVADDCKDMEHSVTSDMSKMVKININTPSKACDAKVGGPSVTCVAGETIDLITSMSDKLDAGSKSAKETHPRDSAAQYTGEVHSECDNNESIDVVGNRVHENVSNELPEQNRDNVDSITNYKVLHVNNNLIKESKHFSSKSEDCDPDKKQTSDGSKMESALTKDANCIELFDDKMEVVVEWEDQSCSFNEQSSVCEPNLPYALNDDDTISHCPEEKLTSSMHGVKENATAGCITSDTSKEVNSDNSHLDPDSQLANQSQTSLESSHSVRQDNCQVTEEPLAEAHSISSQSEARKESSQPEKVVDDSSLNRPRKSSKSEERSDLKSMELNQSIEEDSWDKLYDDSGEALGSKLMEELTAAVGNVEVQKPEFDYYNYQPKDPDIDYDAYGHLIEIYNFPSTLITRDLFIAFKEFEDSGFDIKWVDDNHAIGVFSSAFAAKSALTLQHPLIKVRPLCEATRQTKVKAKKACEFLQPYRPRPETVASVARNLVAGALGIRSKVPKEKREEERRKLHDARERKRQSTREKRDAWDGVIGHCAMDEM